MDVPHRRITALLVLAVLALTGCGTPFAALGNRSSAWINEPKVTTTTIVEEEVPRVVPVTAVRWHNDDIVSGPFETPEEVVAAVFARREGDRFIQASRIEIAAAVPGIEFPGVVPAGAEWVSSQLVIENNGTLSASPTAAFGIWSAEPYTRSRSVAQMVVIRVFHDPENADGAGDPNSEFSCARFAEESTEECSLRELNQRSTWYLRSSGGVTLIWFTGEYRYEMFGRSFVPEDVLEQMSVEMVPLAEIEG